MKRTVELDEDFVDSLICEELLSHIQADEYPVEPELLLAMVRVHNFYSTPDQQLEVFAGVVV